MNAVLQAALERKQQQDAISAEAFSFLDGLLGVPTDVVPVRTAIKSAIRLTYVGVDQADIDLAADMMGYQYNQFNWVAGPGMITVEWGC